MSRYVRRERQRELIRVQRGPLEALLWRDRFAEMLAVMTPAELMVGALRLEGLSDSEIAELLGVSRAAIIGRMRRAQRRITRELPELAVLVRGRRLRQGRKRGRDAPLERGWLCDGVGGLGPMGIGPTGVGEEGLGHETFAHHIEDDHRGSGEKGEDEGC